MDDLTINVFYDDESRVWVAEHDELGLATEAESMDVLVYKLQEMIPELVELNRLKMPTPIKFTIVSHRQALAFA